MFNWKIIVTVIILLSIIAFFISTQTPVQEFFKFIKDNIYSFLGYTVVEERNISFSLVAGYDNISFKDDINLSIYPIVFSANIRYMNIETIDTVSMDFSGSGKISGRTMNLEGVTEKIEIANSSMRFERASIKSNSTFTKLIIDKLVLKELKLRNGSLLVKGTETRFSDLIQIYNLEGRFEFSCEEGVNNVRIEGLASRISIPEADILID